VTATLRHLVDFTPAATSRSAPNAHEITDCTLTIVPVTQRSFVLGRQRNSRSWRNFRIFRECGYASSNTLRVLLMA
jgi:hypothetical protein